jgi:hypothetical protein
MVSFFVHLEIVALQKVLVFLLHGNNQVSVWLLDNYPQPISKSMLPHRQ